MNFNRNGFALFSIAIPQKPQWGKRAEAKKLLRIMKLVFILLTIAALQVSARGFGQESITLNLKDVPIKKVFSEIRKQTGYDFLYKDALLKNATLVNIDVKNAKLTEVLELCFKDQPLTYTITGTIITIQPKTLSPNDKKPDETLPPIDVKGRLVNENNEPIAGASIQVKGSTRGTTTDDNGFFELRSVDEKSTLVVSGINIENYELKLNSRTDLGTVRMQTKIDLLEGVNTGFQKVRPNETTGSYVLVDNGLLNRRVSTNILDRLDGIVPSLLFNKNIVGGTNQSEITIRGRSTIFANPRPLIVIDNFPYTGDINNINPNDVESVTILRDAAAASIWGAFSGNGVIVITTKKGKFNQPLKVSVNSNITIGNKPDLYYAPRLSSSDYIDVEQFLFDKGYYSLNPTTPLSPVVELLFKKASGQISPGEADAQIDLLRNQDTREDLKKYFYRNSFFQQHAINLSGGGVNSQYFFSVGYDKNLANLVSNDNDRATINAKNTFRLLKNKLEVTADIYFAKSSSDYGNTGGISSNLPYLKLADENGNALATPLNYLQSWKDTIGGGRLLDWSYRPLAEIRMASNKTKLTDYRIKLALNYRIWKGIEISLLYQYNKGIRETANEQSQQSYNTRNLINQYSTLNYQTGAVIRPVPLGGILDTYNYNYESHNIRGQLNFGRSWKGVHEVSALAGAELTDANAFTAYDRLYGYNKDLASSVFVDYLSIFTSNITPYATRIPNNFFRLGTSDRFLGYYGNVSYTYKKRYSISASARKDESNIFGVKANQKGVPLWSIGAAWSIDRENFYQIDWLSYLKLRVSDGYNGNIDKSLSAYTTARYDGTNTYGALSSIIVNPPNDSLRWEKVNIVNIGLDFGLKNNVLNGTIEYYSKKGKDLIGFSPLDPTTGVASFKGNTADTKGYGFDITINSTNIKKRIEWNTTFLFSYAADKVTGYKAKQAAVGFYLNQEFFSPFEGYPVYSIFALKYAGLDVAGNPQGYLNKQISGDYAAILNSTDFSDLQYKGSATPKIFGSLRNTFSWKQLSFSFNITYKLQYYFRSPSIDYYQLFAGFPGHQDYLKRWKNPGDERTTNIPSLIYPADPNRDAFYTYSDILVEKGDHIRLQDLQASYDFTKNQISKLPFQSIRLYVNVNNIGILWRANEKKVDPDYTTGYPVPKTFAIGAKIDF